jgi:hypothetical protein
LDVWHEPSWQAIPRSPTIRAYFERVRRDDPQRKKIALVATAHYLVRVMWAMLKRGEIWEECPAAADKPKKVATTIAKKSMCSDKHSLTISGSNGRCLGRASGPEGGGDPLMPREVGGVAGAHRVGILPASCRQAGALIAAPCTPG